MGGGRPGVVSVSRGLVSFSVGLLCRGFVLLGDLSGCYVSPFLCPPFLLSFSPVILCCGVLFRAHVTFCGCCVALAAPLGASAYLPDKGILLCFQLFPWVFSPPCKVYST